jgi:hypothetical protein
MLRRTLIGAGAGAVCGVLALAGFGSWDGYWHGAEWAAGPTPSTGWRAALHFAFVFTAYYWWLAAAVGGFIGGMAGLGSWAVRPRQRV